VAARDAEVREQPGDTLRGHRAAAIGVEGELPGRNLLLGGGRGDEALRQGGVLPLGEHCPLCQ